MRQRLQISVSLACLAVIFWGAGYARGREQRHDLEERAVTAARTLHEIYVLTPNQSIRLVYMNAWQRNVCTEYVVDDARAQSFVKYAVFEKDSKFVNYDLDQDDIEGRCSMAGTDLTNVAEKKLKDEFEDAGKALHWPPRSQTGAKQYSGLTESRKE